MIKQNNKAEKTENPLKSAITQTNQLIESLGTQTQELVDVVNELQDSFDKIRSIPSEDVKSLDDYRKIRLDWIEQVDQIDIRYKKLENNLKSTAAIGASTGVALSALGPSMAMGVATTFGTASTGTAISTLSGAAATNAALAWIGGGTLATGGGGMALGNLFLTLTGPIGWTIAGMSLAGSGLYLFKKKSDKKQIDLIMSDIVSRDLTKYKLANVELNERIAKVINEARIIKEAQSMVVTFGTNYLEMTEEQQYELGTYFNLMKSTTQLLVNPLLGLQPAITEERYVQYQAKVEGPNLLTLVKFKNQIMSLANVLKDIEIDEKNQKLFWKSLRAGKNLEESLGLSKKDFEFEVMTLAYGLANG